MTDPLQIERNGKPIDLEGLWAPAPAFLVCNGKSLDDFPLEMLEDRGIASFGVNNAAARARCKAWCFSDPQSKFHHALFLDPTVMTFAPRPKLKRRIIVKTEGGFRRTKLRVRDCPNTYGYRRSTQFDPSTFFDDPFCHWGSGKHQKPEVERVGCLATVFIGMRLLYYLGVRTIYLLGVDHYGHRGRWTKEDRAFKRLQPEFARHNLGVFNCNPKSDCKAFAYYWSFEDALDHCRGPVPKGPLDVEGWYSKKVVKEECNENEIFTPMNYMVDEDGWIK